MGLLTFLGLRRPNMWEPPTALDKFLDSPLRWLVIVLFSVLLRLRGRPFTVPRGRPAIRVVCLSDTHDHTDVVVPDGDLLIHCGDLTDDGSVVAIQKQIDWLATLPHAHKVFICGNHDSWFDPVARRADDTASGHRPDYRGMHYLQDRAVTLEFKGGRRLNVFGAPALPRCGGSNFAFQYDRQNHPWKNKVPEETDVLITHAPPRHHLDLTLGCAGLLEEVWRVKPRLHVFGHVHWGAGREPVFFDECQRAYESLVARRNPSVFDLAALADAGGVLRHGVGAVLWKWLMLGPGTNNGGLLVNAAVVRGNSGRVGNSVQVVDL